jgi:hypothetical protein
MYKGCIEYEKMEQINWKLLNDKLPKVLVDKIGEYNHEHRHKWKIVNEEIVDATLFEQCQNDYCEWSDYKIFMKSKNILFNTCYFCSYECQEIGEDDMRYYYSKSLRKKNIN